MGRIARTAVLVAVLGLTLSACGSDGADGVATLEGGAAAAEASPSPTTTDEEALQAFAECMRENGVEDFEDPQVDDEGRIGFGPRSGGQDGEPPSQEDMDVMLEAMDACRDLLPEGLGRGTEGMPAEDQAAFQDAMLAYARCMRDEGIDMPDPDFSEGGGFIGMAEGIDPSDPDFQAADEVCRPLLGEVMPGAPQG